MFHLHSKPFYLFFLLLYAVPLQLFSQCESFRVFHISGKASIGTGSSRKDLKTETTVINQSVTLEDKAQVILLNVKGEPVVLTKPVTYRFNDIAELCRNSSASLLKKYFQYIYFELANKEDKEKNQSIRAVVSRGRNVMMVLPPDSGLITGNNITFSWKKSPSAPGSYLKVTDPAGKVILERSFEKDTTFSFILPQGNQAPGCYSWIVWTDGNIPDNALRYFFTIPDDTFLTQYKKELKNFRKRLVYAGEVNALLLAKFYEEHLFFNEALGIYEKSIREFPGNQVIVQLYNQFKIRRGIAL
jgi:hypothetical protein